MMPVQQHSGSMAVSRTAEGDRFVRGPDLETSFTWCKEFHFGRQYASDHALDFAHIENNQRNALYVP